MGGFSNKIKKAWEIIQAIFGVLVALAIIWIINQGPDLSRFGTPYK